VREELMDIHQHVARHQYVMEFLVAIGLLLPVSLVLAGSPLTVNVPIDSAGVQRAVVEADS
jgi:hypothetical protein